MKRILYISIFLFVILCENALSQNYVYTSNRSNGITSAYPFRVSYEDARSEIKYENINFLADTIFSIGFFVYDLGSSYNYAYVVMYDFEIKFRESSGAWQTVYTGNFAPVQGEWNDIFLENPYVKQSSNDLEVSICFNNCEPNPTSTFGGNNVTFIIYYDDWGQGNRLGDTDYDRSDGGSYSSTNNECTSTSLFYDWNHVPFTRFGYDNVNRKIINVCSSNDSITFVGTSSVLPDLSDINNDGTNDFSGPYQFVNSNYISYHYRSRGTPFGDLYWNNADYVCQSVGAHLSHIETRAENNFILNNVHSNHDRWIGAYQNCNSSSFSEPSGGWQWTNGNPVSTNYNVNSWRSIEPNDVGGEHYAMMYSSGSALAGLWNDQPVNRSARFLMEVEDIYVWSTGDTTQTSELTIANTNSLSNSIIWMERLVEEGGRTFKKREYFTVNMVPLPIVAVGSSSPTNEVCIGDSIQIQASGASTYLWNNGATLANNSVSPSTNTTYTVIGTDGNGCENTASLSIAVNPLPTVSASASSFTICDGDNVQIQAGGAISYVWDHGPITANDSVSPLTNTTYTVIGTDLNGCKNTDSVTVDVGLLPSFSITPKYQSICKGDAPVDPVINTNINFTGETWQWTVPSSSGISLIQNSTLQNFIFNQFAFQNNSVISINDTLLVTLDYENGVCEYRDTIFVIIRDRPTLPTLNISPDTLCIGDSINLTAFIDSTYTYEYRFEYKYRGGNWIDFNINTIYTTNNPLSTIIQQETRYRVRGRQTGNNIYDCEVNSPITQSLWLVPFDLPTVAAGSSSPTDEICLGDSILLEAISLLPLTYVWSHGPTSASDSVSPSINTTYSVIGRDGYGCVNTDSITINVNQLPTVIASSDSPTDEVCIGDSIQIQATGASTYLWDYGVTTANDFVSPVVQTTYTVTGADSFGCKNTDSIIINVNQLPITSPIYHN